MTRGASHRQLVIAAAVAVPWPPRRRREGRSREMTETALLDQYVDDFTERHAQCRRIGELKR